MIDVNGHICWHPTDPNLPDSLYDPVVEGGLAVCKNCGTYEAGLDETYCYSNRAVPNNWLESGF